MEGDEKSKEEEKWSNLLEEGCYLLTSVIDPEHFVDRLRNERHLNTQDVETVQNKTVHLTRQARARAFLDILNRRGPQAIERFFYFLQFEYKHAYEEITKKTAEPPPEEYCRQSGVFDPIIYLPDLAITLQKLYRDKKDLNIAFAELHKKLQNAQKCQQDLEMEVGQLKIYEEDSKRLELQLKRYKEELSNIRGENEITKCKYTQLLEEKDLIFQKLHKQYEENSHLVRTNQYLQTEVNELRRENIEQGGSFPQPPPYQEALYARDQHDRHLEVTKEILENDLTECRELIEKLQSDYADVLNKLEKAQEIEQHRQKENKCLREEIQRQTKKTTLLEKNLETVHSRMDEYLCMYKDNVEKYSKLENDNMKQLHDLRDKEIKLLEENRALERECMKWKQKYQTEKRESQNLILQFRERSDAISFGSVSDRINDDTQSESAQMGQEESEDDDPSRSTTYKASTKVHPPSMKKTAPGGNKPTSSEIDNELESIGPRFKRYPSCETESSGFSLEREDSQTSSDSYKDIDEQGFASSQPLSSSYPYRERKESVADLDTNVIYAADELLDIVQYNDQQSYDEIQVSCPPGRSFIELEGGNLTGIYISKAEGVPKLTVGSQLFKAKFNAGGKTTEMSFLWKTLEEATTLLTSLLESCRKREVSDLKLYVMKSPETGEKRKRHPGDYVFIRSNIAWQGRVGNKACHSLETWRLFLVQNTRLDPNRWEAKQTDRQTGRSTELNQIPSLSFLQNESSVKKQLWRIRAIKKAPSQEKFRKSDPYVKVLPVRSKLKFPVILLGKPAVVKAIYELLRLNKYVVRSFECKSTEPRWIEVVRDDAHVFFEGSKEIVEKCQGRAIYLNLIAKDIKDLYRYN